MDSALATRNEAAINKLLSPLPCNLKAIHDSVYAEFLSLSLFSSGVPLFQVEWQRCHEGRREIMVPCGQTGDRGSNRGPGFEFSKSLLKFLIIFF